MHSPDRDKWTPSFLNSSGHQRETFKRNLKHHRKNEPDSSRLYCLASCPWHCTSILIPEALQFHCMISLQPTVYVRRLHTEKVQLRKQNFPRCQNTFTQDKNGGVKCHAYNVCSDRFYERRSPSHSLGAWNGRS